MAKPHNGKIERLFRTLREWMRFVLLPLGADALERKLSTYRDWYNSCRPHSALENRTPQEVWEDAILPDPIPIRAIDDLSPRIKLKRDAYHGDARLPSIQIDLALAA